MAAFPLPNGLAQFIDINGAPLVGGTVEHYEPGGLTPKDTWQNYGASILNNNPLTLDARGQAAIWGIGRYRQIVKDIDGNQIWDRESAVPEASAATTDTIAIVYVIDGGGATITTGVKGDLYIPFDCTITAATVLADQAGSISLGVWKDTLANYPPTIADSIVASAPPTLTAAAASTDTTLTGWTTAITAGNTLRFSVTSIATIQRVTLTLTATKTL